MPKSFKTIILVSAVALLLVLTPLHAAQAEDIWSTIASLISGIATTVLFYPLVIGIFIFSHIFPILAYIFFFICTNLLSWTTKVTFGTIPLTHEGIVDAALPITTGFVNIGFILVLVFIALSTILRLENYTMKKLLPRFILIAILINFVPVICGIIIDVANAVTLSFFKNNDFGQLIGDAFKNTPLGSFIANPPPDYSFNQFLDEANKIIGLSGIIGMIVKAAVSTFFGIFTGGVVLIYALLFLFRVIAIWLLVIMAPIAWFCWILPDTQKYYKMWENYFLQWSFVGAIMGFFLWMGTRMMNIVTNFPEISMTSSGAPDWVQNLLNIIPIYQILTYGSVLAFLIVGFVLSIKMSGGGTETVMKWGEKGFKSAGNWAAARGKGWARDRIPAGVSRFGERMANARTPGAGAGGMRGRLSSALLGGPTAAIRGIGKAMGPGMVENDEKNIKEAEKEVADERPETVLSKFRNASNWATRVGYLNKLIKNNEFNDAMNRGLTEEEVQQTLNDSRKYDVGLNLPRGDARARRFDFDKEIISAMPHLDTTRLRTMTPAVGGQGPHPYNNITQAFNREIMGRIKPERAGHLSDASLGHNEILDSIIYSWDGRQMGNFYKDRGGGGIARIENRIRDLAAAANQPNALLWLGGENRRLHQYLTSNAGREFSTL
ncbi:MAG: hypothetical protein WC514_01335 [Candidatus Paceibacterota bacterium]